MQRIAAYPKVQVSADGHGVVSHVGTRLLADVAAAVGLPEAFDDAVGRRRCRWSAHAPGRVLTDLAVLLADGGEAISDLAALRHQSDLFGPVASTATAWRVLDGHDQQQWQRQRDLPNLIYTNGTQWRLYRDIVLLYPPVTLTEMPLAEIGASLPATSPFQQLITDFLRWNASPITSVAALVRAVAPLTRLLRGEVEDQSHRRELVRAKA